MGNQGHTNHRDNSAPPEMAGPPQAGPPRDGFEIDLRALFFTLRERIKIIGLVVLAALVGASIYLVRTPKAYVASATVEIDREAPAFLEMKTPSLGGNDSLEVVKTIEAKLNTSALLRRLAHDPAIGVTPERLGLPPESAASEVLVHRLRQMLSVGLVRGTRLIGITATHADPDFAARIANGVVDTYIAQLADDRGEFARQANAHLDAEVLRLKDKLRLSESALQLYREQSQSVSLEEKQNIVVAQLQDLNSKLADARTERLKLAAAVAQTRAHSEQEPDQLLAIAAVATAPAVIERQKRLSELKSEFATLLQRYLAEHPRLIQARSQIEQSEAELARTIDNVVNGFGVALDIAAKTEASYAQALSDQEQKALALNKAAIEYKALEREVESNRTMLVAVQQRLQQADVMKRIEQGVVRLVEPAVAPERPARPRGKLILAAALGLGLCGGALAAFALSALDPSLRTVDQAERFLGVPVLVAVPFGAGRPAERVLVEPDEGLLAEAFRTLRTTLALRDDGPRTILFTSATENDGKTFCALNCAAAIARAGSRTLLIDADLRKPAVAEALAIAPGRAGLSEVLQAAAPLAEAVQETAVPRLFALGAGRMIVQPAELLHGRRFADFLAGAGKEYDAIIVDSAPLQAVSDTLLLVKSIPHVCFVVGAGGTNRRAAIKACRSLLEAGASLLGVVLNRAPSHSHGYYYHYQASSYGRDVYGQKQAGPGLLKPAGPVQAQS